MVEQVLKNAELAFALAKKVYDKEVTQQEAANRLHAKRGVNVNSAKIMIAVYGKMMRGLEFKRALSSTDMNYYLARILAEGGPGSMSNPLTALWRHIEYYETKNKVRLGALREIHERYTAVNTEVLSVERIDATFQESVRQAQKLSESERKERLKSSRKVPKTRPVIVIMFDRNPCVVADVLHRANGVCERCKLGAPFKRRSDKTPYLEVHHKIRLADGGEDTVANAIALCPNCHRELHYGHVEI